MIVLQSWSFFMRQCYGILLTGVMFLVVSMGLKPIAQAHPGLHHDIENLTRAIEAEPRRVDLYVKRAILYRLNAQGAASLADLDRARAIDPDDGSVALERGLTLSALGRDVEAETELDRYLNLGRPHHGALAERARIRERTGRLALAVADLSAALEIKPDVELYLARGRILESRRRFKEAAEGYRSGLERLGGAVVLREVLVDVQTRRGAYADALALIDEILPTLPVKSVWLLRRATVLEASGNAPAAHDDLAAALAEADRVVRRRRTALTLCMRAEVYVAMERWSEARRDAHAAVALAPSYASAAELSEKIPILEMKSKKTKP